MKKSSFANKLIIFTIGLLFATQIFFLVTSLKDIYSKNKVVDVTGPKIEIPNLNFKTLEKIEKLKEYPFILDIRDDWRHLPNPLNKME